MMPTLFHVRFLGLVIWLAITVAFWIFVGAAVYLGEGMAGPSPSHLPIVMIVVVFAAVFYGWLQSTWMLLKWVRKSA